MVASTSLICCNLIHFGYHHPPPKLHTNNLITTFPTSKLPKHSLSFKLNNPRNPNFYNYQKRKKTLQFYVKSSVPEDPFVDEEKNGGEGEKNRDWSTSILLFFFWGAIMYYVFILAPNQTPSLDMYFVKKLSNLAGDDGFRVNQVLLSLWYIMGLWPIVYSMLLLPSGRSSKSSIPVWPFVTLSFIGGAYLLLPYFILWRPPAPAVKDEELQRWPLNFLESKLTAGFVAAAGLGLIVYAALGHDDWKEFYQYFRGSKLVHVTTLDFSLLSAFAPFWVYNDMTARKCYDKTAWLLPLSIIPFLGPALYLLLRPSPTTMPVSLESTLKSD